MAWEDNCGTREEGLMRAQVRPEVEGRLRTTWREELRGWEHRVCWWKRAGRREASRPGEAGAAAATASTGARTHVLPPARSARLSSCRRLAGAVLGPHAWSGLLSPGAPTPRRCSPHAAGQPPPLPCPSLGYPGPLRRLLRCKPTREPGQRQLRLLRLRGRRHGGGRVDGAPWGTSAFWTRTFSPLEQRPPRSGLLQRTAEEPYPLLLGAQPSALRFELGIWVADALVWPHLFYKTGAREVPCSRSHSQRLAVIRGGNILTRLYAPGGQWPVYLVFVNIPTLWYIVLR